MLASFAAINGEEESHRIKQNNDGDDDDDDDDDHIMMTIVYTKTSFCFYENRSSRHPSVNDFIIRKAR